MANIAAENAKFTFSSPRTQSFPFPSDVISPIIKNPSSPKGLSKLYQTCKYFYSKRQILVISNAIFHRRLLFNGYGNFEILYRRKNKSVLPLHDKLWFIGKICLENYIGQNKRLPKFFRCSIKEMIFYNSRLYFEDFVILTSEKQVKEFSLNASSSIINSDGSHVSIIKVLEHLPNVTSFACTNTYEDYSNDILQKLSMIHLESKLNYLSLFINSKTLNFAKKINSHYLSTFIENNAAKEGYCHIFLSSPYSDLRLVLNEIVQKWKSQKSKSIE